MNSIANIFTFLGHAAAVELLIRNGANVNVVDRYNDIPLHAVGLNGQFLKNNNNNNMVFLLFLLHTRVFLLLDSNNESTELILPTFQHIILKTLKEIASTNILIFTFLFRSCDCR